MSQHAPITIRLEHFEGPLDLLLFLIQSHEMDVSKISLSHVTDQYLAYVKIIQELNFDIASEFLVMAATLVQWKSKAVLPKEEGEQNADAAQDDLPISQEELIRRLLEHKKYLAAGSELARIPKLNEDVFTNAALKPEAIRVWKPMNATGLLLTYQDILVRQRKRKTVLRKETVSLAEKIQEMGSRMTVGVPEAMSTLLGQFAIRPEQVVTFLASLELSRLKKMRLYQQGVYEEIFMELLETLNNFNVQMAIGFDAPKETVHGEIAPQTTA